MLCDPEFVCSQHPGFDFSGAKFEGEVPEARTFMGGMSFRP
jgi:hypothetical protein